MGIEKTMEFILNAQVRLEASSQQHEERIARLESSMATATDLIGRLARAEIRLAERMESGFREAREAQGAGFEELREVRASIAYKLNGPVDTVDKIVRKNGYGS